MKTLLHPLFALLLASALTARAQSNAPALPREEWGAPQVSVTHTQGKWIITGKKQTVTLDEKNLALGIQAGPVAWQMVPSGANDLLVKSNGKEIGLRLADARKLSIVPYDTGFKTGVKISLSDWPSLPTGLSLYLTLGIEGQDEELAFDVNATESGAVVRQLDWPTALDAHDVDYTVLSNVRGMLLPRNYPKAYNPIRGDTNYPDDTSVFQSNVIEDWCMSWWGFQKGKSAMMFIIETPNDAAYQFSHPAGGPTVIGPRWRATLGKFGYMRSGRMCFLPEGNYVDLAKRYRRYAMDTGLFVSLREKIARKPIVQQLIGTPITRSGILTDIKSDSLRYDKNKPDSNHHLTTFDQRADQFKHMKAQGLDRLCVVMTGWPHSGYDRQHPDEMPPAPAAGGWEGMKRLADTCAQLGYLFSLHDQYRDYYTDAPSFDPQFAVHEEDSSPSIAFPGSRFGQWKEGTIPYMNNWDGGKQSYLNNRYMPGHLEKNYSWLFEHGIHPQGIYLDVFGYVPPDEDFNPEHPASRSDAIAGRVACYHWAKNNIGFIGTEAASDWTVPYSDFSSPLTQNAGIVVPLFNLVYHDAIFTPYSPNDLHGLLNGGLAQFGGRGGGMTPEQLKAIQRMGKLNQRVALLEMTKHEFLDDKFRKERTTFADGTTVTVDWDAKSVQISPDL
jgi:hypothetical protein